MGFTIVLLGCLLVGARCGTANYNDFTSWHGECNIGHSQSPINIVTSNVALCGKTRFKVSMWNGTTTVNPALGAHSSLKSEYPSSVMTVVDSKGKLLQYLSQQYHLHEPSEHTINEERAGLELHIVHAINSDLFSDEMTYAVLGVLFKEVPDDSSERTIFDSVSFTAASFSVNLNATIGAAILNQNVFHYRGSLTTPECSEVVNWFVVQNLYPIRTSQLATIRAQINEGEPNSRPVQDLNQRTVYYITPTCNQDFTF